MDLQTIVIEGVKFQAAEKSKKLICKRIQDEGWKMYKGYEKLFWKVYRKHEKSFWMEYRKYELLFQKHTLNVKIVVGILLTGAVLAASRTCFGYVKGFIGGGGGGEMRSYSLNSIVVGDTTFNHTEKIEVKRGNKLMKLRREFLNEIFHEKIL